MPQQSPVRAFWSSLWLAFVCAGLLLVSTPYSFAANAELTDPNLEQKLDEFLKFNESDDQGSFDFLLALEAQVNEHTPLHSQSRFLCYLASGYLWRKEVDKAKNYLARAWALAESSNDPDVWAEVLATKIEVLRVENDSIAVFEIIDQLVEKSEQAVQERVRYFGMNSAARFYAWESKFEEALKLFQLAYQAIENSTNPRTPIRKMYIKSNIASLNSNLHNWELALSTIQECIAEAKLNPDLHGFIPDLYLQEGFILVEKNELDAAIRSNEFGLEWAEKLNDKTVSATIINNLGDIYMRQGKLDKARGYFEKTLELTLHQEDELGEALARFNLGAIQAKQGLTRQGTEAMVRATEVYRNKGNKTSLLGYLMELADIYHDAKWYEHEVPVLREHIQLSKELFQAEREKQLNQLQEKFAAKERAKQIAFLTQENELKQGEIENKRLQQRVTALIIVVVLLASILLFQLYRKVRTANLKLKEANDQLAYQSLRDPLTGLFNRRSFHEQMQRRESSGERRAQSANHVDGFILLDIDHFKRINDTHGHAAGDAVLIELGKRLSHMSRSDDMVLRWGGEEFLILMRKVDIETLTKLTQRVLNIIGETPVLFEGKQIHVTASAGFLTLPFSEINEDILNWEKALHLADMALYLGKVHGRNRAYGLQHLKIPYEQIKHTLETDLSKAIDADYLAIAQVIGPVQSKPASE